MKKSVLKIAGRPLVLAAFAALACHREAPILPFHYVMGTGSYPASAMAMPAQGDTVQDPDFLTVFVRITDAADGYSGPGIENEYARTDPENCDGSRLILRGNDGNWYLYDPATGRMIKNLSSVFNDCLQEPEPRWDPADPDVFYFLWRTELKQYDLGTDSSVTVHDFKDEVPGAGIVTTGSEGDASLDRRFWCLMVDDSSYNLQSVVVYDRTLDSVVGRKDAALFPDQLNWVSMDMSGGHALIGFESQSYVLVFPPDLVAGVYLPDGSNAHGDLAQTASGADVFVYQNTATDFISFADLNTGAETPLVAIPFGVNPDIGLHFSGNCGETPGWVLVSTYGSYNPPEGSAHSWMDCQLFMVELVANPRTWRIAHTQAYTSMDYSGEKNYFAEAFATVTRRGTRVYWGSNWRRFTADYTDVYQLTLPRDWSTAMP